MFPEGLYSTNKKLVTISIVYNLMVEVQRSRVPISVLHSVERPSGSVSRRPTTDFRRGIVPPEQVAEHQAGQDEGQAHRTARYHLRSGRQHDRHDDVNAAATVVVDRTRSASRRRTATVRAHRVRSGKNYSRRHGLHDFREFDR